MRAYLVKQFHLPDWGQSDCGCHIWVELESCWASSKIWKDCEAHCNILWFLWNMRYELRRELIRHDRMCAMRWYGNEHSIIEHETGCGIIWILEAPPIHFCRGFLRFNVWQRKTSRRSSWKHRRRSQIGVETVELCWTDLFWLMVVNCGFLCISVIDSGVCLYLATSTSLLRRHNCKHRLPTRISYKIVAWSQLSQVKSSHWTNYRMFFFLSQVTSMREGHLQEVECCLPKAPRA